VAAPAAEASAPAQQQAAQQTALTELDLRISRLQQMSAWLQDAQLRNMIDDVIGRRVQAAERRQVYYSVAVGAVSLLVGWLLSAISPASMLVSMLHR